MYFSSFLYFLFPYILYKIFVTNKSKRPSGQKLQDPYQTQCFCKRRLLFGTTIDVLETFSLKSIKKTKCYDGILANTKFWSHGLTLGI